MQRSHLVLFLLTASTLSLTLSSCSSSRRSASAAPATMQEFDPQANEWRSTERRVVPPPSQTATPIAHSEAAPQEEKKGILSKTGSALKAPLRWLPGID